MLIIPGGPGALIAMLAVATLPPIAGTAALLPHPLYLLPAAALLAAVAIWTVRRLRAPAGLALGVVGLVAFNVLCGPYAVARGIAARQRATTGPARAAALATIALGIADLVVLAVVLATQLPAAWTAGYGIS
jgi:hypothetical protein